MRNELDVVSVRLVKEYSLYSEKEILNAEDAMELATDMLSEYDREVLCVMNLDNAAHPINLNIAGIGVLNSCLASGREVFKGSILSNAAGFILIHNHPSGRTDATYEDILTAEKFRKMGQLMSIPLVDFIICGRRGEYNSFKAKGCLDNLEELKKEKEGELSRRKQERGKVHER